MTQESQISVSNYESNFTWKISNLGVFDWTDGNYLLSDENRFDEIDVTWWENSKSLS